MEPEAFFSWGGREGSSLLKVSNTVDLLRQFCFTDMLIALMLYTISRDLVCEVSGLPLYHNCGVSHCLMETDLEQLLIRSSRQRQGVQTQALPGNSAVNITHLSSSNKWKRSRQLAIHQVYFTVLQSGLNCIEQFLSYRIYTPKRSSISSSRFCFLFINLTF